MNFFKEIIGTSAVASIEEGKRYRFIPPKESIAGTEKNKIK